MNLKEKKKKKNLWIQTGQEGHFFTRQINLPYGASSEVFDICLKAAIDVAFFISKGKEFQHRGTTDFMERGSARSTKRLFLADRVL